MSSKNTKKTKYACYFTNISMATVVCLSPLLFTTFQEMYGISYTKLGFLVLVNFFSQLTIDLIFTFFSKHFNIKLAVRLMPVINLIGLLIYGIMPLIFNDSAYIWLLTGTIIYSISAGLSEVLISPVIAGISITNKDKEMSALHSIYAWGLVAIIIISSIFLKLIGYHNWNYLVLILTIFPIISSILFINAPIPEMNKEENIKDNNKRLNKGLIVLFVACIFLEACAENTMTGWVSTYAENALRISKLLGDILGMAMFAVALGLGRTLYAKFGKNILRVMLFGFIGATLCYLIAGITNIEIIGLMACILTGLSVSMLWPGTLIIVEEVYPNCGVFIYAMLAAGGDTGNALAPQLLGIITDAIKYSNFGNEIATKYNLLTDQVGIRFGMLITAIFPLIGIIVVILMKKLIKKIGAIDRVN